MFHQKKKTTTRYGALLWRNFSTFHPLYLLLVHCQWYKMSYKLLCKKFIRCILFFVHLRVTCKSDNHLNFLRDYKINSYLAQLSHSVQFYCTWSTFDKIVGVIPLEWIINCGQLNSFFIFKVNRGFRKLLSLKLADWTTEVDYPVTCDGLMFDVIIGCFCERSGRLK